jgi:hypothetical protein
VPFGAAPPANNVIGGKQNTERLFAMDGGLDFETVELINAADGFRAAAKETQMHTSAMDEELRPYATNPEAFQGPLADEFRRLYREIWDDLETIRQEATAMSDLVDQAKAEFVKRTMSAAGNLPGVGSGGGGGGGTVLQGLSPR